MKQIFMGLLKVVEQYGQIHMKLTLPQRKGFSLGLWSPLATSWWSLVRWQPIDPSWGHKLRTRCEWQKGYRHLKTEKINVNGSKLSN